MNRPPLSAWRIAFRAGFVGYAALLHTVTHWPQLAVMEAPFSWFDKVVHFGAFGTWTALLSLSGWFGEPLGVRNLRWCLVFGLLAGALDELTQGIPAVGRDADLMDWLADAAGAASAAALLYLAGSLFPGRKHLTRLDRK